MRPCLPPAWPFTLPTRGMGTSCYSGHSPGEQTPPHTHTQGLAEKSRISPYSGMGRRSLPGGAWSFRGGCGNPGKGAASEPSCSSRRTASWAVGTNGSGRKSLSRRGACSGRPGQAREHARIRVQPAQRSPAWKRQGMEFLETRRGSSRSIFESGVSE